MAIVPRDFWCCVRFHSSHRVQRQHQMPPTAGMKSSADLKNTPESTPKSPATEQMIPNASRQNRNEVQKVDKSSTEHQCVLRRLTVSRGPERHMPVTMITPAFLAASTSTPCTPAHVPAWYGAGELWPTISNIRGVARILRRTTLCVLEDGMKPDHSLISHWPTPSGMILEGGCRR